MDWKEIAGLFSWHKGGLRRRLLWIGLIFLGLALFTNTIAGSLYTRKQIKKAAAELQVEVAARVARQIQDFVRRKVERLADLANSLSLYELGSEEQRLLALIFLKNDVALTEISVLDSGGIEVLKISERRVYLPSELSDQSQGEKFRKAFVGGTYLSAVYTSDKAEPYVTLAVPLKLGPRRIIGVVSAELNLKFLWQVIGEVEFGSAGYAYLIDHQGNLIAYRDPSLVLKKTNLTHINKVRGFLRDPAALDPTPADEGGGITGKTVLSTFAPVHGLGWAVVLEEPVDAALAELQRMQLYAFLLLGLGLLVGAALIVWASGRITRPIRELQRGVEVIAQGDLDHRVEIKTRDEIEQLAEGFNTMAAELKSSYATLESKVEQRTKELSALYNIAATTSQSLDIGEILYDVVNRIKDVMGAHTASVFTVDWSKEEIVLKAQRGLPESYLPVLSRVKLEGTLFDHVVRSGELMYMEDFHTDSRAVTSILGDLKHEGSRSVAILPLRVKKKVVGVLAVGHKEPSSFSRSQMDLLNSIADEVAVAIENTDLFEEVKQKSKELEALVRINRDVAALLDRETLLPRIAEEARRILKVDAVSFRLMKGDLYVREGHAGEQDLLTLPAEIKVGKGLIFKLTAEMRVVAVRNLKEDSAMSAEHRAILSGLGYCSFLAVPLVVRDSIIMGIILLYSKKEREFQPEEIRLISSFADQASIAVQNANLFAEVRRKTAELEELNRDLQEANRAKADFLAAMSHELRTPLNVIIGNAELFRDGFFGDVNAKQRDTLEKILRYSQVLLKLISDVLMLTRIEAKKMSLDVSTFTLDEVINHLETFVEQLHLDGRVEIVWNVQPHLPPMTSDALKLEEILQNLIGNAAKFTPKGRIEVQVRDLPGQGQIEFAVADTGIGIEQSDLEKIFDAFHQLKEAHTGSFSGAGLGLNIVKNYLELMQGEIRVESELDKGSTFTFTLPYFLRPEKQVPEAKKP